MTSPLTGMADARAALMEAIELLRAYSGGMDTCISATETRFGEAVKLLGDVRTYSQAMPQLTIDPSAFLQQAYSAGKHEEYMPWNNRVSHLRDRFVNCQQKRCELLLNRMTGKNNRSEMVATIRDLWGRVEKCRSERNLAQFVNEEDLGPVYDSATHIYSPRYFSSRQSPVNPVFVSRILKGLRRCDSLSISSKMRDDLRMLKPMLSELVKMKNSAKSDNELAELSQIFVSKNIVEKYTRYNSLKNACHDLQQKLDDQNKCFVKMSERLKLSLEDLSCAIRTSVSMFHRANEELNLTSTNQRRLALEGRFLDDLKSVIVDSDSDTVGMISQSFRSWSNCVSKVKKIIDDYDESTGPHALQNCISELMKAKNDIAALTDECGKMEAKKSEALSELQKSARPANDTVDTRVLREQREKIASMVQRVQSENIARDCKTDDLENMSVCLLDCMRNMLSRGDWTGKVHTLSESLIPELQARTMECAAVESMIEERKSRIASVKEELQALENSTYMKGRKSSEDREGIVMPGIDAMFMQTRLLLACPLCDRTATTYVDDCGHLLCDRCVQKLKKTKGSQCPVCRAVAKGFVTLKFGVS